MKKTTIAAIAAVFCGYGVAHAQLVEIGSMTVLNTVVDFDAMAAGPTTVGAINTAFPMANLLGITLTPPTAAPGVYNTNPAGRALAGNPNGDLSLYLVDPPAGDFGAFAEMIIDLGTPSTQFGFNAADWNGPINVRVYNNNVLLGQTPVDAAGAALRFVEWQGGGTFDRVELSTNPEFTAGNWVVPEMHIQAVPEPATVLALGAGVALLAFRRRRK